VVIVVLLVPMLAGCSGVEVARTAAAGDGGRRTAVPDLQEMGLAFAKERADGAGGYDVEDHDASGRDRRSLDDRDWQVCFQVPQAAPENTSTYPRGTQIRVGVVRTTESCPRSDRGVRRPVEDLGDLVGRTASMARRDLGSAASIQFVRDRGSGRVPSWNLGAWRVCSAVSMNSSDTGWHGQPVRLRVAERSKKCR
jgi:hypothetical protein